MLYKILFYPSKLALHFYCRSIVINNRKMVCESGPMLIAANHPNSFLDAIIVSTLFKLPVYSLARGDAFAGKFFTIILKSFNMLPIYRVSEGLNNLGSNYETFTKCEKLFRQNKIVLIFCEGGCVNEWHLRPLKKGTARLAVNSWKNEIPLKVLPLGINYSSFKFYGKNVVLNFGTILSREEALTPGTDGKVINQFNEKLNSQLKALVFEIDKNDREKLVEQFYIKPSWIKRIVLFIPAIIGFIVNVPLYFIIHLIIKNRAVDHYDSIMTGLLFLFYPIYVLAITLAGYLVTGNSYSFLLLFLIPLTAWSYLQLKTQIRR